MVLTTYRVAPGLKTAALERALLVFHPGSGTTVALTGQLLDVFLALQAGQEINAVASNQNVTSSDDPAMGTDGEIDANQAFESCMRLLRQHQLIVSAQP